MSKNTLKTTRVFSLGFGGVFFRLKKEFYPAYCQVWVCERLYINLHEHLLSKLNVNTGDMNYSIIT